jgi:hypothetical protein
MIRFVCLDSANSAENVYSVRVDGEHVGYFIGTDKYARAIETAVMIVQRTPLALDGKRA